MLDLAVPLQDAPDIEDVEVRLRDAKTLEVSVPKSAPLNDVFNRLATLDIAVMSMRNKANRLEELFMRLVERNLSGGTQS